MDIDVSVILPVYNAAAWMRDTLEALAAQTLETLEVIAVDDGSTDDSGELLDRFAQDHENWQVIHCPNQGVWRARQEGIRRARGRYIGFCDSDDIPAPAMYERLLRRAVEAQADMAVCAYTREEIETGTVLAAEMTRFGDATLDARRDPLALPAVNTALWNKLIRSDLLAGMVDFEHPPRIQEDMMLLCSLYPRMERVAFISEPLYRYKVRGGSAMTRKLVEQEVEHLRQCMQNTRRHVESTTDDIRYLYVCDTMAFIHMGLAVILQHAQDGVATRRATRETRAYLNKEFPYYHRAGNGLWWNLTHHGLMLKPWFAAWCYRTHTIGLVMDLYRWLTRHFRFEVKW